jgi:glycosyltransferase involved in cell wall biosynthesis
MEEPNLDEPIVFGQTEGLEGLREEARSRAYPEWSDDMLKVLYVGAHLYPTGYGEACRLHMKAMKDVGVGVMARLNQLPPVGLKHELVRTDNVVNEMLDLRFWPKDPARRKPDAGVWHVTPDTFGQFPDMKNFGYTVWETVGLPYGWADACNRMDGLLTCSEFSASLFREGGVTVPIRVCPHPMDVARFRPDVDGSSFRASLGAPKTVFLVVSQWMFRKGVEDAVVAYASEFKADEPVALVLLTWRWSHAVKERVAIRGYTKFLLNGLNLSDTPPVWHIGDNLPPVALPNVYAASDVLVSASRGEAFALPIFEAAACGKPSISTGWGGMWSLLSSESAYPVAYDMETVHGAGARWKHYHAGQKWARPRLDDLRRAMREAHEDVEGRTTKGLRAYETTIEHLSPQVAGAVMRDAILDLVRA